MSHPAPGGGAMRATPTSRAPERASAGQPAGRADAAFVEESASR